MINSSSGDSTSATEHYARLSTEDLNGLLQARVLAEGDTRLVVAELQGRGVEPSLPTSRLGSTGEVLITLVAFVIVMSAIGRGGPLVYVFMYLSFFIPCLVVAIVTSRIVPKYRSLPYSALALRTSRVVAVLGVLIAFGTWYGQQHN